MIGRLAIVELDVCYNRHRLAIGLFDDGVGILPEHLRTGKPGHFGLTGMRERAQGIGASFEVRNRKEGGVQVELRIAARRAYTGRKSKG